MDDEIQKPSYTYWKRESDDPFSNDFKPTKSDDSIKEEHNSQYGSAWNKAGTW